MRLSVVDCILMNMMVNIGILNGAEKLWVKIVVWNEFLFIKLQVNVIPSYGTVNYGNSTMVGWWTDDVKILDSEALTVNSS